MRVGEDDLLSSLSESSFCVLEFFVLEVVMGVGGAGGAGVEVVIVVVFDVAFATIVSPLSSPPPSLSLSLLASTSLSSP